MMRISGRGTDGTAKPFQIDKDNLKVHDIEGMSQIIKSVVEPNRKDIYANGVRFDTIDFLEREGNGAVTDDTDHIKVALTGNNTNIATIDFVTRIGVLKKTDNYKTLYFDFEYVAETQYNGSFWLYACDSQNYDNSQEKRPYYKMTNKSIPRTIAQINVSNLNKDMFVGVRMTDATTAVDVKGYLKIYGIYAVRENTTLLAAKDSNNETKALSSETDNEGRNVLRVVDSAPYAYDASKDALQVSIVDKRVKTLPIFQDLEPFSEGHMQVSVDLSSIPSDKMLVLYHTYGVDVTVTVFGPYGLGLGGGARALQNAVVKSGATVYWSKADLDLLGLPVESLLFRIVPISTPTTGTLTMFISGV